MAAFITDIHSKQEYINILSDFKAQRAKEYGINRMGIFGSVARGEQSKKSDLDIYFEGDAISLFKIVALKDELERLLHCTVDIVRLRKSMNEVLKNRIEKEGIYV